MSGYIGTIPTPQATQTRDVFTATATQTTFATSGYTVGFLDVYVNGVHLKNGTDYAATNGSDVVMTSGLDVNDYVEVVAFSTFSTSDTVSASGGGTFSGPLTVTTSGSGDALTITSTDAGDTFAPDINFYRNSSSPADNDGTGLINFKGRNDNNQDVTYVQIQTTCPDVSDGSENGFLSINTMVDGSLSDRLVIDSNGSISKNGSFSYSGTSDDFYWNTGSGDRFRFHSGTTSSRDLLGFSNPNGVVGSIETNGSSTSYNTSSDYRLKENVTDITDPITRVKQLSPKRFNFIADADAVVDGFLAHEVSSVVLEAVTGEKDEVDADGNPVMQGIDQSKLVPLLTAALQEAITKIETLETKVAALEAE